LRRKEAAWRQRQWLPEKVLRGEERDKEEEGE
jgi:hypothetical protein